MNKDEDIYLEWVTGDKLEAGDVVYRVRPGGGTKEEGIYVFNRVIQSVTHSDFSSEEFISGGGYLILGKTLRGHLWQRGRKVVSQTDLLFSANEKMQKTDMAVNKDHPFRLTAQESAAWSAALKAKQEEVRIKEKNKVVVDLDWDE